MKSKLAFVLAALSMIAGCEPEGPGQDTADTSEPELGPMSLSEVDEVVLAEGLSLVPFGQFWLVVWLPMVIEGDCPALEAVGEYDFVLTGGCTDATGNVWTGSVTFSATETELRADLDGWGVEGEFWGDGALVLTVLDETAPLVADGFTFSMPLDPPLAGQDEVTATYTGLASTVPAVDGAVDMTGDMEITGGVRVAELGDYSVAGWVGQNMVCDLERDAGTFAFLGDGEASVTYDGATACDGCYTATTSDGVAHQVCAE